MKYLRFIKLSLKNIVINNLSSYYSYLELPNSYINCDEKSDFCSIHFKLLSPLVLISLCRIVSDKLILLPINSLDGISIVTQQLMGNPMMSNVSKPAILQ